MPNPLLDAARLKDSETDNLITTHLTQNEPKNICIIGAGPSGLGALKVLLDHPSFQDGSWKVTVYEARESIGGVWLPAPAESHDPPLTPLYDALTTNIPHPIMAYTSMSFPPSTPLYPHATVVLKYLETFTETFNLAQHIQFNHRVVNANWDQEQSKWRVRVTGTSAEGESEHSDTFDLLVVANGHYSLPRYPPIVGLKAWTDTGKVSHSVYYRNPSHPRYAVETILVVGGGPSGTDISTELHSATGKRIIHSLTDPPNENLEGGRFICRGRIAEFLDPEKGEVRFEDGTTESGIGHCVLATGYQDHFPFLQPPASSALKVSFPPPTPPLPSKLYNSAYHVFPLARHVFPLVSSFPPSSIAFLGLPFSVVPFPLVEAQMRAVLKVLEHPERLDPTQEAVDIVSRYEDLRTLASKRPNANVSFTIAKLWHKLRGAQQFSYRDALHALAGPPYDRDEWKVPSWVGELYALKGIMRAEWRELEKSGEAEEWARGVGEKDGPEGSMEWVELMRKVVRRAEKRKDGRGGREQLNADDDQPHASKL